MLKDSFCSSPWFHIRIDPAGRYLPCRWSSHQDLTGYSIADTSIAEFVNSDIMQGIRARLLDGDEMSMCDACLYEDSNNKVSGRQRQLLKSAIKVDNFEKTLCASPHFKIFNHSFKHNGHTNQLPVDLQIDLGNTCNSACIMCSPVYSSRIAAEYPKLRRAAPQLFPLIEPTQNWTDNPKLVDKFVGDLACLPDIKYIHFLGGETLYLKSFYDICNRLIDLGIAKNISIGTTTNCTVYTPELERIIREFKHVHLGLSIEAVHQINDYVRWPSQIDSIVDNIKKFMQLREKTNLHLALRITPNIFSIYHLDTLFEFMIKNGITAESCNILHEPSLLRIELLPQEIIDQVLVKINQLIATYDLKPNAEVIVNRRRDDLVNPVIAEVIFEYKHFLETYNVPLNIEQDRKNLIAFLGAIESSRNNTILDYLPEYEEFLRSYGY